MRETLRGERYVERERDADCTILLRIEVVINTCNQ